MKIVRTLGATLSAVALFAVFPAVAQDYPTKPIRLLVPYPTAGTTDPLSRMLAEALGKALGQPVIIENRPGANGNIGTAEAVKAAPDGYTLAVVSSGTLATNPALLILDEPTRGIDVRAKEEIMDGVTALCKDGMAVLFISSELPEVLRCSDRVLVLRDRKAGGEYRRGELTDSSVLAVIAGEAA